MSDKERVFAVIKSNPGNDYEELKKLCKFNDMELIISLSEVIEEDLVYYDKGDKRGSLKGWKVK